MSFWEWVTQVLKFLDFGMRAGTGIDEVLIKLCPVYGFLASEGKMAELQTDSKF